MLKLVHIHKDYMVDKKPFTAIKDLSLEFPDKGVVAILGPSGCGKTTLLNIIGGLDHYTSGDLLINGKSTKDFKDKEWDAYRNRHVGFVFQSYNLIPHMTVAGNVEIAMTLSGVSYSERAKRAQEALDKVGLGTVLKKKPNQLSGGQMQRVAIARALVNKPEIVLADEPTGALDSNTSVQVMDILKSISNETCVILVTHNRELAEQYADRIIEMKDGEVISDTKPSITADNEETPVKEIGKKTSMSFVTALKSSGRNVMTKKGRTTITAVACSIGIIGVALVLATRSGFTDYIGNVEASMASSMPITISPTVYDLEKMVVNNNEQYPSDNKVHIQKTNTSTYVAHRNNYKTDYIEYLNKLTTDPKYADICSQVMYNRNGLDFHILTESEDEGKVIQVNQYSSAGGMGSMIGAVTSLPSTRIHELYGMEQYEPIYGRTPTNTDELVLVLDTYNQIDERTLSGLGITTKKDTIDFSDIIYEGEGDTSYKTYKAYKPSVYYRTKDASSLQTIEKDCWDISIDSINPITGAINWNATPDTKQVKCWTIGKEKHNEVEEYYGEIYNDEVNYEPINLKIVGVLRPKRTSPLSVMPASLAYATNTLGEGVKSLKDIISEDVSEGGDAYELAKSQGTNYFIPRDSDPNKDGFENLKKNIQSLIETLYGGTQETTAMSQEMITALFAKVYKFYFAYDFNKGTGVELEPGYFTDPTAMVALCMYVGSNVEVEAGPSDLSGWLDIITSSNFFSEKALKYIFFYSSYANITSILVFPSALSTKGQLRDYLDAWNEGKADVDKIIYTDVMDTFTSSIGTMIDVISVVLVVFAAVSLVVSSVMTAIITYVSVIERTKEIGIMRACGARKKDVGRIFESECIITGGVAGIIGVAVSWVACFPINFIVDHQFPGNNLSHIANLNWIHAIILIVISIALAFISGFIPARIASKKDPVICLRSE